MSGTTGKTVLVTGCSAGGIGSAVALALASRGHHVFATARSVAKILPELADHPGVSVLALDVADPASIAAAVQAVAASGRPLDVLFNNAGAGYAMPVLDVDIDRAKDVYEVNVWGVVRAIQAFAPLLIQTKGRIVNLSTCGAAINTPWIGMSFLLLPCPTAARAHLVLTPAHSRLLVLQGRPQQPVRDPASGAVPLWRLRRHRPRRCRRLPLPRQRPL